MVVKNLIKQCLYRLRIIDSDDGVNANYEELPETKRLLRIFNFIIAEITSSYIPILFTEDIVLDDKCQYEISKLSKPCNKIKQIKIGTNRCSFNIIDRYIVVTDCLPCEVQITYSYIQNESTLNDVIILPNAITDNMVICGMLTEYCMTDRRVEEALAYDAKYRDYIKNSTSAFKTAGNVRARRW